MKKTITVCDVCGAEKEHMEQYTVRVYCDDSGQDELWLPLGDTCQTCVEAVVEKVRGEVQQLVKERKAAK